MIQRLKNLIIPINTNSYDLYGVNMLERIIIWHNCSLTLLCSISPKPATFNPCCLNPACYHLKEAKKPVTGFGYTGYFMQNLALRKLVLLKYR